MVCFGTKLGTQPYFVSVIVFKWIKLKKIVICLKSRAKLRFLGFLSVFGTFSHKVVRTCFGWHETLQTTLFRICYCV